LIFNRVSRWTTSVIVPLSFVMLVLRDDILRAINSGYTGDTRFMVVLLVTPLLGCAFGLAGNCIVFTGHSRWNLFNNVATAALATYFNTVFIPDWKLLGAAISAALASVVINALQLWELAKLEHVHLHMRQIYHPFVAFAFAAAVVVALWDPAQLPSLWIRAIVAAALFTFTIAMMIATGHPELRALVARRFRAPR
jgi:O-antigen/teichoic acid export membrane protein